jgi:hypothetical protein
LRPSPSACGAVDAGPDPSVSAAAFFFPVLAAGTLVLRAPFATLLLGFRGRPSSSDPSSSEDYSSIISHGPSTHPSPVTSGHAQLTSSSSSSSARPLPFLPASKPSAGHILPTSIRHRTWDFAAEGVHHSPASPPGSNRSTTFLDLPPRLGSCASGDERDMRLCGMLSLLIASCCCC